MKLREFRLLTDENIDPDVVAFLREEGFEVADVCENGIQGISDAALLQQSVIENRVIVTHDSDFGTLAMLQGEPVIGILFLRPGHIDPQFTVDAVKSLLVSNPDVTPPFVVVLKRSNSIVTIRTRHLGSE